MKNKLNLNDDLIKRTKKILTKKSAAYNKKKNLFDLEGMIKFSSSYNYKKNRIKN